MNAHPDPDDARTLEILDIVQKNEQVSQRHLARQLGVALGLANSYLKRCVKKGWVKVQQAPANRYLYYVTPKGFAEKGRLTAQYLSFSFSFYRAAGDSCTTLFEQCERNGWHRLLLCGVSDLAEIATLRAMEHKVEIVGFYDPSERHVQFLGKQAWSDVCRADVHDARLLTEILQPRQRLEELNALGDGIPLLVPDVLRMEPPRS